MNVNIQTLTCVIASGNRNEVIRFGANSLKLIPQELKYVSQRNSN